MLDPLSGLWIIHLINSFFLSLEFYIVTHLMGCWKLLEAEIFRRDHRKWMVIFDTGINL